MALGFCTVKMEKSSPDRGLALGGIAGIRRSELLQHFFGFPLAAIFPDEPIEWIMIASTLIVRRRCETLCMTAARGA